MTKRIALCCFAVGILASVPLTPALPQAVFPQQLRDAMDHWGEQSPNSDTNANAPPAKQNLTKIVTPYKRAPPSADAHPAKPHLTKIVPPAKRAPPSTDAHPAKQTLTSVDNAPDTQNFIQLSQPEDQPLQNVPVAPTSYSAPEMQPDLADSDVSEDDPS